MLELDLRSGKYGKGKPAWPRQVRPATCVAVKRFEGEWAHVFADKGKRSGWVKTMHLHEKDPGPRAEKARDMAPSSSSQAPPPIRCCIWLLQLSVGRGIPPPPGARVRPAPAYTDFRPTSGWIHTCIT